MELVVRGRNVEVPDHFRQLVADKFSRVERYDAKIIRTDVELHHERNRRQSDVCQRIEITCRVRGPVVRAEACAGDFYAALDLAMDKIERRFRRAADRRRVHHGRHSPTSLAAASANGFTAEWPSAPAPAADDGVRVVGEHSHADTRLADESDDNPALIVREKRHEAVPMSINQALLEMELVGHDFYLFQDADADRPSVVYRRHAYDYGVIRLG